MRDFFKGRRRKVACAAMALAVLLGLMWVRSHFFYEFLEIATPRRTKLSAYSNKGSVVLVFTRVTNSDPENLPWPKQAFEWMHRPEPFNGFQTRFIPHFETSKGGEGGPEGDVSTKAMASVFPYHSASLLVAAIALCLFLWKPRKKAA